MSHADDDLIGAMLGGAFDSHVDQRNEAFGSFERKTLSPDELLLNELLEDDGFGEVGEDADLLSAGETKAVLGPLHSLHQPVLDVKVVDVHELHADRSAISVSQAIENLAEGEPLGTVDGVGRVGSVEIFVGKAVEAGIKFNVSAARRRERTQVGDHVSTNAIRADELIDPVLLKHPDLKIVVGDGRTGAGESGSGLGAFRVAAFGATGLVPAEGGEKRDPTLKDGPSRTCPFLGKLEKYRCQAGSTLAGSREYAS